jgi:flagellar biosynthesis activator protein FlaF
MTWEAYETVAEDGNYEAREREGLLLSRAIERLERANGGASQENDLIDALLNIRRLWAVFIEDLARSDNALPEKLRAEIISIGIWIFKEADLIQKQRSGDLTQLIEINRLIRDALT